MLPGAFQGMEPSNDLHEPLAQAGRLTSRAVVASWRPDKFLAKRASPIIASPLASSFKGIKRKQVRRAPTPGANQNREHRPAPGN
ncbi:ATP-dependent DNA helicase PcrA [Bradyrhizobium diazoefficiens]|nr:ATP-dependent DNA helicase PcrA [Bradyrhizobium diazoefficiens]